jgi:hypothetical protein
MQPGPSSEQDQQVLQAKVLAEVTEHPPTIGVIGISDVGMSSTVSTLLVHLYRKYPRTTIAPANSRPS